MEVQVAELIKIAHQAGQLVLSIYNKSAFQVMSKENDSLLTEADIISNTLICDALKTIYPAIPIISEESSQEYAYEIRKSWQNFFLVDPLDGTKEFVSRNGEFTINIALIRKDNPIVGVVHAPALGITFYAEEGKGAYKIVNKQIVKLSPCLKTGNKICVVTSRSHASAKIQEFLRALRLQYSEVVITAMGSALKFGLIADGSADIYPRLAPTMEWDTAAGQVIVSEVGKQMKVFGSEERLKYNKIELVNPSFIVG